MHMLNATIMLIVCMYHAKNVHFGHRVSTCALYMYYAYSNYVATEY
jgi:hypothetical protein